MRGNASMAWRGGLEYRYFKHPGFVGPGLARQNRIDTVIYKLERGRVYCGHDWSPVACSPSAAMVG